MPEYRIHHEKNKMYQNPFNIYPGISTFLAIYPRMQQLKAPSYT